MWPISRVDAGVGKESRIEASRLPEPVPVAGLYEAARQPSGVSRASHSWPHPGQRNFSPFGPTLAIVPTGL